MVEHRTSGGRDSNGRIGRVGARLLGTLPATVLAASLVVCGVLGLGGCDGGDGDQAPTPTVFHAVTDDDDAGAFYAVWSASPSDVWVVGGEAGKPLVRHFDGSAWSRRDPPLKAKLRWVHGDGAGKVLVVGDGGQAALWDGAAWTAMPTQHAKATLWGCWLAADGQAWTVGGVDGASAATDTTDTLLLLHHDPTSHNAEPWALVPLEARATWPTSAESRLFKVWRDASTGRMFAVGGRAVAATTDSAGAWSTELIDGSGAPLFTVHGRSASDVWAVGGQIGVALVHYDGSAWSSVAPPDDAPFVVQGVAVRPDGVVDLAGATGYTARRTKAGAWISSTIETNANLHGIHHDGKRLWTVGGDIAVDKADHHGAIYVDDASVPAITP